eukprot:12742847-Alexandrium_andersonii.AAC.1
MSASLVGSEMCIRDRALPAQHVPATRSVGRSCTCDGPAARAQVLRQVGSCLLYTSDAADDM